MLEHNISAYNFFQAVQLLTENQSKNLEKLFFKASPSMRFFATDIISLEEKQKIILTVSFLSIAGPMGLLPLHYTEALLKKLQQKETSLIDFLDIFHHQAIKLFYLAWKKYRLYLDENILNHLLLKLTGFSQFEDKKLLFYTQYFANQHRTPEVLSQLLSDYFSIPVKIISLKGEWLEIEDSQKTKLPSTLGVDMSIGTQVYFSNHKFRLQIGPLTLSQFKDFLPSQHSKREKLFHLIRLYIGPILNFDVQFFLYGNEIEPWKLTSENSTYSLGWNMWLNKKPFPQTVGDLIIKETRI
jgi:type VI secretion system protein ImpH